MKTVLLITMVLLQMATPRMAATSTITGTISSPEGFSTVGVNVAVIPCPEFLSCTGGDPLPVVSSDANGSFRISDLPSGFYSVVVFYPGSAGWTTHPFFLPTGQTATVSPSLPPGSEGSDVLFLKPTASELSQYTGALEAMNEPRLCSTEGTSEEIEHYRFLWLRSFGPTVVARLTLTKTGGIVARFKQAPEVPSSQGKIEEDLSADVVKDLIARGFDPEEAAEFPEIIQWNAEDQFWDLPYSVDDGSIGVDGATWVVEGMRGGKCHVVERWSPDRGDPLHQFAWQIIDYTGKRLYYDEVY